MTAPVRHFLEVDDLSAVELAAVLDLAGDPSPAQLLAGRGVVLLFEKPSLRTRSSTEVAVVQLGGHPVSMRGDEVGLGSREPAADIARVLSRHHALLAARVFEHAKLVELAAASSVPVVNLLSDDAHPCQALADLLTLRERFGGLAGLSLAYVGDFNNVARSLSRAAALAGVAVRAACPTGYGPTDADVEQAKALGGTLEVTGTPQEAVGGADAVYTDVWASMGREHEAEHRRLAFAGYTVDGALMAAAAPEAVFLHCLPAHRGEEVTGEVVDGPRSLVWDQAENRLHAARGLLMWLLSPPEPEDGA